MPSVRQPVLVIAAIVVVATALVSASPPAADDDAEKRLASLKRWLEHAVLEQTTCQP